MLETNIRIIRPGNKLFVRVRRLNVEGQNITSKLLERVCSNIRYKYRVAAAKDPENKNSIIVASSDILPQITINENDYEVTAKDSGNDTTCLYLSDSIGPIVIPTLAERALLVRISKLRDLWTLNSPRIFYESSPFLSEKGIDAFHRYEVAATLVDKVGIGVVADIGTAFFTSNTLEYYFNPTITNEESRKRKSDFISLTSRQEGQKGTLLYDNGKNKVICYFEDAPNDMTCVSTPPLSIKSKRFSSLYEYYEKEYPSLPIVQSDPVIRVSFSGIGTQLVAAKLLKMRVMNDNLPASLSSIDKITPQNRKQLLEGFWNRLEPDPLGKVVPGLFNGFWQPKQDRTLNFVPPQLEFGGDSHLNSPSSQSKSSFQSYYRSHLDLLGKSKCYRINPSSPRTLQYAYPESLQQEIAEQFSHDMIGLLSKWTGLDFTCSLHSYSAPDEAFDKIQRESTGGIALFVLDNEPSTYYDVAFNLPSFRVKRATYPVVKTNYDYLKNGAWDNRLKTRTHARGKQRWERFITMNALDILQLLDMIPYRIATVGPFEGQLVIDVGQDRRFFSVSLLIARDKSKIPSFHIHTRTQYKPDSKHEGINPILLKDEIVNLFQDVFGRKYDPLESLLILRDGKLINIEEDGINEAINTLRTSGIVEVNTKVDVVGFHKGTLDQIRLWENDNGNIHNPLEGSGIVITPTQATLALTGDATLNQGTADPIILMANEQCLSISEAARSAFEAAQLNWSSPGVAQRLPLPMKRTDEELEARSAQLVRRIK